MASPRPAAWAFFDTHPYLSNTRTGSLSRHSAGEAHALGGCGTLGSSELDGAFEKHFCSSPCLDTFALTAAILFAVAVGVAQGDRLAFLPAILLLASRSLIGALFQDRSGADSIPVRPFWRQDIWRGHQILDCRGQEHPLCQPHRLTPLEPFALDWVGCAAFALAYSRFSFADRRTKSEVIEPDEQQIVPAVVPTPHPQLKDSPWAKFLGSFRIHFRGMAKNTVFVVVVMIA